MSEQPRPPRRALSGLPPRRTAAPDADESPARLLRANRDPTPTLLPADDAATSSPTDDALTLEVTDSRTTEASSPDVEPLTESRTTGVPKYLQLVRRETRLHHGQVAQLADLTRALNDARRGGQRSGAGERITDNTLMRIAVDLLLADPQRLRGTTEDELRASVGLPPMRMGPRSRSDPTE